MKTITIFLLLIGFAPNPYANKSFYSRYNTYQGKVSPQGNIYNRHNIYQGSIKPNGSIYDRSNTYRGQIKGNK